MELKDLKETTVAKTQERINSIVEDIGFYEAKLLELRSQLFALRKWQKKLSEELKI